MTNKLGQLLKLLPFKIQNPFSLPHMNMWDSRKALKITTDYLKSNHEKQRSITDEHTWLDGCRWDVLTLHGHPGNVRSKTLLE